MTNSPPRPEAQSRPAIARGTQSVRRTLALDAPTRDGDVDTMRSAAGTTRTVAIAASTLPLVALSYAVLVVQRSVALPLLVDGATYLTIGALGASAAGAATFAIALMARGKRVPGAPIVLLAGLPWFFGTVTARLVGARGDTESIGAVLVPIGCVLTTFTGSVLSALVLAGFALGVATIVAAQRAPERRRFGAAVGACIGLAILAVTVVTAVTSGFRHSPFAICIAAIGAISLAIAGGSAGTDRASSAMAATVGVAASLSVIAAARAVDATVWIDAYFTLPVGEEDHYPSFISTLHEARALTLFSEVAWFPASVAATAFAAWAFARSHGDTLRALGAAAMISVAAILILGNAGALTPAREFVAAVWGPDEQRPAP